jgi:hypothetical protein
MFYNIWLFTRTYLTMAVNFVQCQQPNTRQDPYLAWSVNNWTLWFGYVIQDIGSADPNPDSKKIFMDPQHYSYLYVPWFGTVSPVYRFRIKLNLGRELSTGTSPQATVSEYLLFLVKIGLFYNALSVLWYCMLYCWDRLASAATVIACLQFLPWNH